MSQVTRKVTLTFTYKQDEDSFEMVSAKEGERLAQFIMENVPAGTVRVTEESLWERSS